jgi:hypothetical protein
MLRAGAVSSFFGTTRDTFEGKEVTHLEYEAYPEMALASMLEMCSKVCHVRSCGEQTYKLSITSYLYRPANSGRLQTSLCSTNWVRALWATSVSQ